MQPSITFTVVAAPNKKLVRKTWAVVLCQIGNRKVHIEASRWPAATSLAATRLSLQLRAD